jgi:uncharacterized delta-60 repeat protein
MKYLNQFIFLILITFFSAALTSASIVDESFRPFVTKTNSTLINAIAIQPDGKYLVGGDFTSASGEIVDSIARFNPDGTLDSSFKPQFAGFVYCLFIQNDGKILVGGTVKVIVNGITHLGILRFNPDGSLDSSFLNGTGNTGVRSIAVQPDGKVIVGGTFASFGGPENWNGLARLNTDGSLDTAFNPRSGGGGVFSLALLADGKIMAGGEFTSMNGQPQRGITRLNSDGSLDSSFTINTEGSVKVLKLQADGKIMFGGRFDSVSGFLLRDLGRLNADGTLDQGFHYDYGEYGGTTYAFEQQPDGKILVGGLFQESGNGARRNLFRLNQDGSIDEAFSTSIVQQLIYTIAVQNTGQILAGGTRPGEENAYRNLFYRFNSNGNFDSGFPASVGVDGAALALGALPNGKIYVGGDFVEVNGKDRKRITRLNANGTLDTTFNSTGTNGTVFDLAVQPDGKVIIVGDFGLINGASRLRIARLNYDGSLDTSFNIGTGVNDSVNQVTLQPDGKIIIGGIFAAYNGITRNKLARLNGDGSLDTSFNAGSPGPSNSIQEIATAPDGKILVGGTFGTLNGQTVGQITRLNPDGTRDMSFNAGGVGTTGPPNILRSVNSIIVQPDGKIMIGGIFNGYNNISRTGIARLNPDGTLEPNFAPAAQNIAFLKPQADGKILVGGLFGLINGVPLNNIARINSDGSLDAGFDTGGGADKNPLDIVFQPNGNIIVAGVFRKFGGQFHGGIAQLKVSSTPLLKVPFDFDGDGKTDISIFRPSVGEWWYQRSSDGVVPAAQFGIGSDLIMPGDFTGDGKTDIAFFRPSDGFWYILRSEDNSFFSFPFGTAGDIPAPADYDGDGKTDAAVFRPSSGTWFILNSGGSGTSIVNFGASEDKPTVADYDGDGKADISIFRPSDGSWWYLQSSNAQYKVYRFGVGTDKPVQGDYTGDGRADIAVFRPSTGDWFIQRSEDNSYFSFTWGQADDIPAPGDYDGDGKTDAAIFRPSNSTWFINRTTSGVGIIAFGSIGDQPVPNTFVP